MKINKSTWIDAGRGHKSDILKALNESTLPDHAVMTDVDARAFDLSDDGGVLGRFNDVSIKFEWIDEE